MLSGRYVALRSFPNSGNGGYAELYIAYDLLRKHVCVLKVAHEGFSTEVTHEADLLWSLPPHQNCVSVYDRGIGYYTMEHIVGVALTEYIYTTGIFLPFVLDVMRGIFMGLAHYHAHGLCHNDLKPNNVLITWEEDSTRSILIDPLVLVETELFTGTPLYASPERMDSDVEDPRCDLFSAGVIFYMLVAGDTPWTHNNADEITLLYAERCSASPPRHVPMRVRALIYSLLSADMEDRPRSAEMCLQYIDDLSV